MVLKASRLAALAAGVLTCSAATLHAQTATPHGAILVRVADASDQPLWGGDIDLPVLDVHFSVPDGGRLLIKDVPPGTYVIQAKRIGYALERRLVKVGADTTRVQFTMYAGTTLDTVKVTSFAASWSSDFDRRRKLGFGSFFNAAYIQEAQASQLRLF